MKSQQQQILDAVADYVRTIVPNGWEVEVVKSLRLLSENVANHVAVVPHGLGWKRAAKGRVVAEHQVDLVVMRRIDVEEFDETVGMLDRWARTFLLSVFDDTLGKQLDDFPCINVETIDGADAGFDLDELTATPSNFFGGLRLTFWGD